MPYTYLLQCADGSFYCGSTAREIEARVWEHNEGLGAEYTKRRLPVSLVWCEWYARVDAAFAREKQIQGWGRRKRLALIDRRDDQLPDLSCGPRSGNRETQEPSASG